MLVKDIIKNINKLVGNSSSISLTYKQLGLYLNSAVDYINSVLKTNTKNFDSIWNETETYYRIINSDQYKNGNIIYNKVLTKTGYSGFFQYRDTDGIYKSLTRDYIESKLEKVSINVMDYNEIDDDLIRNVLIYYAAASYLEEEDELENQYKIYLSKADEYLNKTQRMYYSMLEVNW